MDRACVIKGVVLFLLAPALAVPKSADEKVPSAAGDKATAGVAPPVGLFVCRGPNPTPEKEVDFPFIDGWLVRPARRLAEPLA